MASVTAHCMERYVERILGITDTLSIKQYITLNRDKVSEDINKMIKYSKLIYTGQINGDKTSKNYYLSGGNIILVIDTNNGTVVTLYEICFGFSESIDKINTANLVEEINTLQEQIIEKKVLIDEQIEQKKVEIDNVQSDIKSLEEQLFMLKFKHQTLQNELKVVYNDIEMLNKQLECHALKICNSLEYRKELAKITK
jgi:hypothetical protein